MISVVMAVYNIGNMQILEDSVNSILNQTVTDIELIICDDFSTDGTYEKLRELAEKDSRILLIRNEENMKAAFSRNRCIKLAKGDFIAIMDGDDISAPDRLEKQAKFLKTSSFDFVGSRGMYFNKTIGDMGDDFYPFYSEPQKKDFLITLPFLHASIMFRREVFEKIPGYSNEKITVRNEDYDMLIKMYSVGLKGANLNDTLYYYRTDNTTFKKRKYRYRFNETAVKWRGFYRCGLFPKGIIYALKPLIIGLLPVSLLEKIKKQYYKNKI